MPGCCCSPFECAADQQFNQKKVAQKRKRYQQNGAGRTTRLLLDGILKCATVSGTVLDIGCGIGALTFALLERGATSAVAVDASAESIAPSREEAARSGRSGAIRFVRADRPGATLAAGSQVALPTVRFSRAHNCQIYHRRQQPDVQRLRMAGAGLHSPAPICATNDGHRHARGAALGAFPTSTPTPPKTTASQCWPPRHTIPTAAAPRRSWLDHRRTSDLVALRSHLPREYGDDDEETMTETRCAVPTTVDRHVIASGVAVRADRRSARMTYPGGRRTDVVRVTRLRASPYRREGDIRPGALIGVPVPPRRGAACSGPGQPVPRPWPLRHRT